MATGSETQQSDQHYHFSDLPRLLEGMREAMKALKAEGFIDGLGRLRAVTEFGQTCCPITLLDLRINGGEETPVEKVARVLRRQKPLLPPHLMEVVINAADNARITGPWGSLTPKFEVDVQLALDEAMEVNGKRRHPKSATAPDLQAVA